MDETPETPLTRRMDRFLYETGDAETTVVLLALKELAAALEAMQERLDRLADDVRRGLAAAERETPD